MALDIYVVSDRLTQATDEDVTAAETVLGTHFPATYREYVTTLGVGYCNGFARVYLPAEIVSEKAEFQQEWALFAPSRYQTGFDLLPLHRMLESIILATTVDGDEVVFHPDTPDDLYVLPRQDWHIYRIGRTLDEALTWVLTPHHLSIVERTSVLTETGEFVERVARYFIPDVEREGQDILLRGAPYEAVRAYLVELALASPGPTLCLCHQYPNGDGTEGEALHLFVQEYGGEIVCNPCARPEGIKIAVEYDADRRTESLDRLLAYLRSLER